MIESALVSAIQKHPKTPLVIAYSGGVDSQVLLHALAKLKHEEKILNTITVCHVNHGLSENAGSWQNFAEQVCKNLILPFITCQVNVPKKAQQSLEALARKARYQALQSIYNYQSLVVTGHHRDDQAETFLLALKRGAGLKGLSAMSVEAKHGKDIFVRPLLNISRAEIILYAKTHQLDWVEDESNSDTRFDRNFIRQKIMPLLNERWPSITQTISRSSSHCLEGQLLLDELAEQDLVNCQLSESCLSISNLSKLSIARFNNLIRYFLAQHYYLMPSIEQLSQVYQQLLANEDKNPTVKVANNYLRRYKNGLYLTADFIDLSDWKETIYCLDTQGGILTNIIELPDALGTLTFFNALTLENDISKAQLSDGLNFCHKIISPTKNQKVTLRFGHSNPNCLPDFRKHSRSLKKILQELNIPPWQRKRIPFLYYNEVLVAALGYFVCREFTENERDPSMIVTWES